MTIQKVWRNKQRNKQEKMIAYERTLSSCHEHIAKIQESMKVMNENHAAVKLQKFWRQKSQSHNNLNKVHVDKVKIDISMDAAQDCDSSNQEGAALLIQGCWQKWKTSKLESACQLHADNYDE